jgi:cytochrome c553
VCGLLGALCALAGGMAVLGLYRLNTPQTRTAPSIQVARTPEQLARGERLAYLCVACHSSTGALPLDGGTENFLAGLGTLYAPNVTPDGPLKDWSDGEISRAIREGVDKSGRALLIMPSEVYHNLSDADVQALVAYLRTQPAVERRTPATAPNLISAVLLGAGIFPTSAQRPITSPVVAPPAGPTPEYGRYLVAISGCGVCHGANLTGGSGGFVPAGPSLPAIIARWSAAEFISTMRTGVDPSRRAMDPQQMPWRELSAAYGDEELRAIYEYIRTLAPAPAAP